MQLSKYESYSHQIIISGLFQKDVLSLLSEVGLKTAIGHEGHDDVGGWTSISADSNQTHDIGMVKLFHLHTFLHDFVDFILIKESCSARVFALYVIYSAWLHLHYISPYLIWNSVCMCVCVCACVCVCVCVCVCSMYHAWFHCRWHVTHAIF